MQMAMKVAEKYNLSEDDVQRIFEEKRKDEHLLCKNRTKAISTYQKDIRKWEEENGLKSGDLLKKIAEYGKGKISVEEAKTMLVQDPVDKYAEALGISEELMKTRLQQRKKIFGVYNAKFLYDDIKLKYDLAAKTMGTSVEELSAYCKENKQDMFDVFEKLAKKETLDSFKLTMEEYGMSGKEFFDYCKETDRDPLQLAQRTAAEIRGEYKIGKEAVEKSDEKISGKELIIDDALIKESDAATVKAEEKIRQSSVKDHYQEMEKALTNIGNTMDAQGKVLRGRVVSGSAADTIVSQGKLLLSSVILDLRNRAVKGERMDSRITLAPMYLLATHELLKEELSKGTDGPITRFLNAYKGKEANSGMIKLAGMMQKIPDIRNALENRSVYDMQKSLHNGTFAQIPSADAVKTLKEAVKAELGKVKVKEPQTNRLQHNRTFKS